MPFQKTWKKKCPDGAEKVVYYNVDDAFPLYTKDWTATVAGVVSASKLLEGNLSAELKSQLSGWLIELDNANRSLQQKFRSAYVVYSTDPCNMHEYLIRRIEAIDNAESELRKIEMEFKATTELLRAGASEEAVYKLLARIAGEIPTENELGEAFRKAQTDAKRWMTGS
jgi:hypothetical protein